MVCIGFLSRGYRFKASFSFPVEFGFSVQPSNEESNVNIAVRKFLTNRKEVARVAPLVFCQQ